METDQTQRNPENDLDIDFADRIKRDLKILGVRNTEKTAIDRENWTICC